MFLHVRWLKLKLKLDCRCDRLPVSSVRPFGQQCLSAAGWLAGGGGFAPPAGYLSHMASSSGSAAAGSPDAATAGSSHDESRVLRILGHAAGPVPLKSLMGELGLPGGRTETNQLLYRITGLQNLCLFSAKLS